MIARPARNHSHHDCGGSRVLTPGPGQLLVRISNQNAREGEEPPGALGARPLARIIGALDLLLLDAEYRWRDGPPDGGAPLQDGPRAFMFDLVQARRGSWELLFDVVRISGQLVAATREMFVVHRVLIEVMALGAGTLGAVASTVTILDYLERRRAGEPAEVPTRVPNAILMALVSIAGALGDRRTLEMITDTGRVEIPGEILEELLTQLLQGKQEAGRGEIVALWGEWIVVTAGPMSTEVFRISDEEFLRHIRENGPPLIGSEIEFALSMTGRSPTIAFIGAVRNAGATSYMPAALKRI